MPPGLQERGWKRFKTLMNGFILHWANDIFMIYGLRCTKTKKITNQYKCYSVVIKRVLTLYYQRGVQIHQRDFIILQIYISLAQANARLLLFENCITLFCWWFPRSITECSASYTQNAKAETFHYTLIAATLTATIDAVIFAINYLLFPQFASDFPRKHMWNWKHLCKKKVL